MLKVSDLALDILKNDEVALEALRAGLLNLSAYAQKIQPQIEKITYKSVQKGTIVVALSRIAKEELKTPSLKPDVKLLNLSIKSALCSITFERTADIERRISVLNPFQVTLGDLFSVTEGPSEVTLVISEKAKDKILTHFDVQPKYKNDNLVAITAELSQEDIGKPNIIYTLSQSLAAKRINLIEVISTSSEVSFIMNQKDLEEGLKALNIFFVKQPPKTEN